MTETPFVSFPKIGRLSRGCIISEKIDGTNGQIYIGEDGEFLVGSRNRWITPGKSDNMGFARWAYDHKEELMMLGPGKHFGEWWGVGIQRRYGLTEKRFSLFNTARWADGHQTRPACCHVVPVIYEGAFTSTAVDDAVNHLARFGSLAAPGFTDPEGVVVYHAATKQLFKKTIKNDESPKGQNDDGN